MEDKNKPPFDANTMEPLREGVFEIPEQPYHLIKAFNYSNMKILHDLSPRHLKCKMDGLDMKPITSQLQARFDFGSAVDLGIFEPERFAAEVVKAPPISKNSKKYKEWAEVQKDKLILSDTAYQRAHKAVNEVKKKNTAMELLSSGWAQKSVLWRHPELGFWCKCRPDWIINTSGEPVVMDLKTTENASQEKFTKQTWRLKYYWQAHHYMAGLTAVTGIQHRKWRWLVLETWPPFESNVFAADPAELERASIDVQIMYEQYAECIETDEWPGYVDEIVDLGFEYEYPEFDPEDEIPF